VGADYQDQPKHFDAGSSRHKTGDGRKRPEQRNGAQDDSPSGQKQQKTGNSHSAKFRITDSAHRGARGDSGIFE